MIQMQTTGCVVRECTGQREGKSHVPQHCFNSDTTGERKQKKHKGLTATARLKRQAEGGGGGGGGRTCSA